MARDRQTDGHKTLVRQLNLGNYLDAFASNFPGLGRLQLRGKSLNKFAMYLFVDSFQLVLVTSNYFH